MLPNGFRRWDGDAGCRTMTTPKACVRWMSLHMHRRKLVDYGMMMNEEKYRMLAHTNECLRVTLQTTHQTKPT
jgi:hypothetical protein